MSKMDELYNWEDEHNVQAYWESLKEQDVIARDSQGRPSLQDEARATWYGQSNELRAIARDDFETWEQEQLAWWDEGCQKEARNGYSRG